MPTVSAGDTAPFVLGELTFSVLFHRKDQEWRDIARLRADGTLEVQKLSEGFTPAGVVAADGTLTANGKVIVRRAQGGSFSAGDGTPVFELDGDALVIGNRRVTVDEAGAFAGMPGETRVTGATDASLRRTSLLVLGLLVELSNEPGQHGLRERRAPTTP